MDNEHQRIRLKIDLDAGTIELDAPAGEFEAAIAKTRELAGSLDLGRKPASPIPYPRASSVAAVDSPSVASKVMKARAAAPRSSSGRPGRIGSFEPIRDLLSEEQQQTLHAFMAERSPEEQSDQILVAVHKGQQLLDRRGFSYNEIYTLLWRARVDPLPKAIDVVVQRLIQEQRMDKGEDGFYVKFLGQQRVEKELPAA